MKPVTKTPPLIAGSALFALFLSPCDARSAPTAADPFQAYVSTSVAYEDNVFRLDGASEGERTLGTRDLQDAYARVGAGFDSVIDAANQEFDLAGNVFRRVGDRFDELDHTGGRFRAAWNWRTSDAMRGDLGYRYRRELRQFTNRDVPSKDLIDENAVFAGVERRLAQRWSVRVGGDVADLQFSDSPLLDKRRVDLESELQYDASQDSRIGLLVAYTRSRFEEASARDFDGWSVGPSIEWQYSTDLSIRGYLSYTRQGLDEANTGVDDFDGVTGAVRFDWRATDALGWRLRLFRDLSDLGGEVAQYTERTGVSLEPTWRISEALTGRAEVTYEKRDFVAFAALGPDREDDWYLASAWLDLEVARRWLISAGVSTENRRSNEALRDFDAFTAQVVVRFDL